VTDACPATNPGELVVRGSVEQVHVINAEPGITVHVNGSGSFTHSATTDGRAVSWCEVFRLTPR
jgi:hypothetical protein